MPRYVFLLLRAVADFAADTVGIFNGNIEEVSFSGSLIMCYSSFYHVPQIVELMTQVLYRYPTLFSCPVVRVLRVHGAGCIKVTVRFLCSGNNDEYAVNVLLQFLVRIGLQRVTGSFYCFVYIGIVEREALYFVGIAGMCCLYKVFVTSRLFTFAECQRDGYFTACLKALSPKVVRHFNGSKGDRVYRIPMIYLRAACYADAGQECRSQNVFHLSIILV